MTTPPELPPGFVVDEVPEDPPDIDFTRIPPAPRPARGPAPTAAPAPAPARTLLNALASVLIPSAEARVRGGGGETAPPPPPPPAPPVGAGRQASRDTERTSDA